MDGLDWVFSAVLALFFLIVGVFQPFFHEQARDRFPWVKDVPPALVRVIGVAEILGALGLILPAGTGIYAWPMPVAAVGLGLLMLMAVQFHPRRHESAQATLSLFLLLLMLFVAYGRWPLLP